MSFAGDSDDMQARPGITRRLFSNNAFSMFVMFPNQQQVVTFCGGSKDTRSLGVV